jgi:nitroreductase
MDALECIHTRRSVRKFKPGEVTAEQVEELLKAAMTAPSANNQQPWHFIVVDDREKLDKVPDVHPYAKMVLQAPLGILICAEPALEKSPGYWQQDCASATLNMLNAARAIGLGTCWTGVHPREERVEGFRALFGVPKDVVPFAFVVVGHPDVEQVRKDRYNASRVHKNTWQG